VTDRDRKSQTHGLSGRIITNTHIGCQQPSDSIRLVEEGRDDLLHMTKFLWKRSSVQVEDLCLCLAI